MFNIHWTSQGSDLPLVFMFGSFQLKFKSSWFFDLAEHCIIDHSQVYTDKLKNSVTNFVIDKSHSESTSWRHWHAGQTPGRPYYLPLVNATPSATPASSHSMSFCRFFQDLSVEADIGIRSHSETVHLGFKLVMIKRYCFSLAKQSEEPEPLFKDEQQKSGNVWLGTSCVPAEGKATWELIFLQFNWKDDMLGSCWWRPKFITKIYLLYGLFSAYQRGNLWCWMEGLPAEGLLNTTVLRVPLSMTENRSLRPNIFPCDEVDLASSQPAGYQ